MKWIISISVLTFLALLYLYERNKLQTSKEKVVILCILGIGAVITGINVFSPNLPGPNQWAESIYNLLKK